MRYREGMIAGSPQAKVSEGMLVFSAGLGLGIGILMFILGRYARQWWMVIWGAGLVLASLGYIAYSLFSG